MDVKAQPAMDLEFLEGKPLFAHDWRSSGQNAHKTPNIQYPLLFIFGWLVMFYFV